MSKPGQNKGEHNFKAKLTETQVKEIFLDDTHTQEQLALKYNVTQSTINHIKKGRTWAWLTAKIKQS